MHSNYTIRHRIALCLLFAGAYLSCGGIYSGVRSIQLNLMGTRVDGVVVAYEKSSESDDDKRAAVKSVVEFADSSGGKYRLETLTASFPPRFLMGEKVPVLYLHSSPANAKFDSQISLWLAPFLGLASGSFFLILGGGIWAIITTKLRARLRLAQSAAEAAIYRPE